MDPGVASHKPTSVIVFIKPLPPRFQQEFIAKGRWCEVRSELRIYPTNSIKKNFKRRLSEGWKNLLIYVSYRIFFPLEDQEQRGARWRGRSPWEEHLPHLPPFQAQQNIRQIYLTDFTDLVWLPLKIKGSVDSFSSLRANCIEFQGRRVRETMVWFQDLCGVELVAKAASLLPYIAFTSS